MPYRSDRDWLFSVPDGFRNNHQLSGLVVKLILLRALRIGKVALTWHLTAFDGSNFFEWLFSVTGAILKLLVPTEREQALGQWTVVQSSLRCLSALVITTLQRSLFKPSLLLCFSFCRCCPASVCMQAGGVVVHHLVT